MRAATAGLSLRKDSLAPSLGEYFRRCLAGLHPAYFAMVMATGIVSLACHALGLQAFGNLLFWLNIPIYLVLWVFTILRARFFTRNFFSDWTSHQLGPGFFTIVAATDVLGMQFLAWENNVAVARALWWFSVALWMGCTYTIFVALSIRNDKPALAEGINGGWLLAVVATQSICVLGCAMRPAPFMHPDHELFFLMSFWLCGGMLYIWMIALIFYRYMFFRFDPADLMPPYWINMGAVAVSTLAGTMLVSASPDSSLVAGLLPFVKGLTMMFWSTATWWIPMLVILGIWRHGVKKFPIAYHPLYWGLVFPLGMYSLCTWRLSVMLQTPMLASVAKVFVVFALVAWWLTFLGVAQKIVFVLLLAVRSIQNAVPQNARPVVKLAGSKIP